MLKFFYINTGKTESNPAARQKYVKSLVILEYRKMKEAKLKYILIKFYMKISIQRLKDI